MNISRNLNLRLGIETEVLSQTIRGIGTYTLALIQALEEFNPLLYHSPNSADALFPQLDHHHFFKPPQLPFAGSLASLFRSSCFNKVDLMLFPDPKILYGLKPKVPFLLTVHDLMPLKFPHFFPKKSSALMRYFLPRHLKDAAAIVAVSEQTKRDLAELFPFAAEKATVIPCALPSHQPPFILEKKEPFFLYVGSFEPRKNLPGIVKAFAHFKAKGFPHTLVIAGKEEKNHRIPWELIRDLGLDDQIVCRGYVSEEEKQSLLQRATCLVWPSFYEGFGLPLLEALAHGTPIVTSKIPVLEEVCGPCAHYVDPHSPSSIAEGLEMSLTAVSNLERAKLFSLQKLKENYMSLIYERGI